MMSKDLTQGNLEKIKALFPNSVIEVNRGGKIELAIDFDVLRQELSSVVIDEKEERYQMTWPDKKKSILLANSPISKTLRPCKEESVNFDNTQNLYIEGDNLDVLKLLQETYLGKVKMIYIDPPYNAGADLLYKNKYQMTEEEFAKANFDIDKEGYMLSVNSDSNGRFHTDWLNLMYMRLKIARDLLTEDGCIVIAIDHNELANIIKVTDEIFMEDNRLGIVTVVHKPEGRNQERYFATSNEFALFYAKNKSKFDFNSVVLDDEILKTFNKQDEKGLYRYNNYIRLGGGDDNKRENKPHFYYPIYVSTDLKHFSLEKIEGYHEVFPVTKTQERTWKTKRETTETEIKNGNLVADYDSSGNLQIYEKYRIEKGQLIKTHWIDKRYNAITNGTKVIDKLFNGKTFDFPKSLYLLTDTIKLIAAKDSIVLDFFSGSATTAHAVMHLNAEDGGTRKFICVQLPAHCNSESDAFKAGYKNICEIGKERIRRAGAKIAEENRMTAPHLDIGFRVLKLDTSNMKDVYYKPSEYTQSLLSKMESNIKEDRTSQDLLFQTMLDFGTPMSAKIEEKTIQGKKVFVVADNFLIACFDNSVSKDVITEIAKQKPLYFVMKSESLERDSIGSEIDQIFDNYSPSTERKVL